MFKLFKQTTAQILILTLCLSLLPTQAFAVSTNIYTWLKVNNYTKGTDLDSQITADPGDTVMFHLYVQNQGVVSAENLTVNFTPTPLTGGLAYPGPDVGTYRAYHYNNDGAGTTGYISLADLDLDGSSGGNGDYVLTPALSAGGIDNITYLYVKIPDNFASSSFSLTATPSCTNGCNVTGGGQNIATVNVNVHPVLVSNVIFSPAVIANNGVISTNVTADVADLILPSNITSVTIDLSSIGGNPATPMYDDGFNGDGVAGDGKYGALNITSTSAVGTYSNLRVSAVDANSNQATADGTLILIPENAPVITLNSISRTVLSDQAGYTQSTVNWQTNQDCGTGATQGYRVERGGNGVPLSGTQILDWNQTCFADTPLNLNLNNTDLNPGANTIYLYVSTNSGIGYNLLNLEKDLTAPTLMVVGYTDTVNTEQADFRWQANENGVYTVRVGGDGADPTSGTQITGANASGSYTDANAFTMDVIVSKINAGDLAEGDNTVYVYLTDDGGNLSSDSAIIKRDSTPRLSPPTNIALVDNDNTLDSWLDGRDFSVTWTKPSTAQTLTYFDAYHLYLLPEGVALNAALHTPSIIITDLNTESWTGTGALTLDSAGNTFNTGDYVAWIYVSSTDPEYEDSYFAPSPVSLITSEVPTPPVFQNARFLDDTTLLLVFDTTLHSDLNLYTASGITSADFTVNTGSGTNGVDLVNGQNLFIKINSLNNAAFVSNDLNIATGSVVASNTGLNDQVLSAFVADGQSPTLTLINPASNVFSNGAFNVSYQINEEALDGSVKVRFQNTGGAVDPRSLHTLVLNGELANTLYSFNLNANNFTSVEFGAGDHLVNGSIYSVTLSAKDLANNTASDVTHLNFGFDTQAPLVPLTIHFPNPAGTNGQYTNDTTPFLNWFSSTDNLSATGSLVYNLELSAIVDFSILTQNYTELNATAQELNALVGDGKYYWRVNAKDESGNASAYQNITENFVLDTTAPVIQSAILTDQDLPSISYTKNGNTVVLTATLSDTNQSILTTANLTADLTPLGGGAAVNPVTYNPVTGAATWTGIVVTCVDGLVTIPVDAQDVVGNSAIQASATLTCDNTLPTLNANTLTSPNGGENWQGGSTQEITWNPAGINETNFVSLSLEYSANNGTSWTSIATGEANDGTYTWTSIPNLNSNQMLVRLIAVDQVSQTGSDVSNSIFILDSTAPTLTADTLLTPNGGEFLRGGMSYEVTWANGEITDTYLPVNPISLEYYDGGAWVSIATGEANDGTYTWNPVPNLDINTARVRLTAMDTAGNTATDTSNLNFTLDSTLPSVLSAETQDLNGNGAIDALKFTFTENISDTSVLASDFDVLGYNNENFNINTNGDSANNNIIYLTFDEIGIDTAITPNYTYTQGSLTDLAGNFLATVGSITSTDKTKPIVLSRLTQDRNGDGQLDAVLVTFSENMDSSQTQSTDFIVRTSLGGDLNEVYSDVLDDATLLLGFSNGTLFDTSDLTRLQLFGNFQDLSGNALVPETIFTAASDGAAPVFTAQTWIANITPAVKVTFSEAVDSLLDNFTDWQVAGFNVIAMDFLNGSTNTTLLSLDSAIVNTALTPNVTYSAGDVQDLAGNPLLNATVVASDSLRPTINQIEIHDLDSDGAVETAFIEFSEIVEDASLNVAGFTLASVTADNFSTDAFGFNLVNDQYIAISLNTGIAGTIVRDVLYSASIGGLTDLSTGANLLQDVTTGDVIEIDKAGPALLAVTYSDNGTSLDVSDDTATLTFSEELDDTTVDFLIGNSDLEFTVANGGSIANASTTSETVNDNQLILNLAAGDTALMAGMSTLALLPAVLGDLVGNLNSNVQPVTINGTVILNEIMWMGTNLSPFDEYIELKNMSANPIDLTGWVIENGATGTGLILPGGSLIPANGYFLIANFDRANSQIDLDPDWVTTSLDLGDNANGNLVLKNGDLMMDSAKGDTWPAGDGLNFYSMERDLAPGDGLQSASWHTADAQENWDGGSTEKGTPGAENVADSQAPTFQLVDPDTRLPRHNTLFPNRLPKIQVAYADNTGGSGINTGLIQVFLDLNNDGDFLDVNEEITAQTTITNTQISYLPTTTLSAGKHSVKVMIGDIAGNTAETIWSFWLDDFRMTVENQPRLTLFAGVPTETQLDTQHIKITVQTYGAGIDLKGYLPLLASGINSIPNWNNTTGIGWDVKEEGGSFTGTIQPFANDFPSASILASKAKFADGNYALQTYTFYVKVYGEIDAVQATGLYQNNFQSFVELTY